MLEPLDIWKSSLKRLEQVDNPSWAEKIAGWADERSTMKLALVGIVGPVHYTFNRTLFQTQLQSCTPTSVAQAGAMQIASAWAAAAMASPLVVLPGSALGAPTPFTMWSAVTSVVDAGSVQTGKMLLVQKLTSARAVSDTMDSIFAEAFRSAFLAITATVTGINSMPFPSPLVSPMNASV